MKIIDVKATTLKGYKQWNYIQIETDEGITGLGEAHPGEGVIEVALKQLKPLLLGKDPRDVEPLYHQMVNAPKNRSSICLSAIGGVETALWDLTGKALGVPVYRLLGGKYRDRIRLYADVGWGKTHTPEAWAERAREGVADGYQALKFDIDGSANELRHDAVNRELSTAELAKMTALVAAVREAVGDAIDICIDCHGIYSVHAAILLAQRLEPFNLIFLEDPVPNENVEAMAKVSAATSIPICTGEFLYRRDGFRELIQEQACGILHVDVSGTGGMLEAKKIADLADLYYMPFAAHNITSPVGMTAAAHVCAAVRNLYIMELPYHADQVSWRWDLVQSEAPLIQGGEFVLPEAPGLGIELNADVARAHLMPGHDYFG
ncbi:MAG: mandelate racemase/muconate lactonizing enzyme family protein [Candidatus Poribacteria bacterium]|nr:mandelate racemase/muconate lactonizing enzyme family protein [Candidatus Poribacteria bacterium]